jgi:acyl carrier protein
MGLEGVEMVLEVEESFDIDIPKDQAQDMLTPRQLIDYVLQHVGVERGEGCRFQRTYFRVRRAFRHQLAALASDAGRGTRLKDVLHKDQWPRVWAKIRDEVGAEDWPTSVPWPGLLSDAPKTVGELAWYVALSPQQRRTPFTAPWTRDKVSLEIRRIIYHVLGKLDYSLDAQFVKDLGVG